MSLHKSGELFLVNTCLSARIFRHLAVKNCATQIDILLDRIMTLAGLSKALFVLNHSGCFDHR